MLSQSIPCSFLATALLFAVARGSPTLVQNKKRGDPLAGIVNNLIPSTITNEPTLTSVLSSIAAGLQTDASDASQVASEVASAYESVLEAIKPTGTPNSIPQVTSIVSSVFATSPTILIENVAELVLNGLSPSDFTHNVIGGVSDSSNSFDNVNPRSPAETIYPKKSASDAPYSLSEAALRAAINIPSTFQYGAKPPVILVPGTGNTGGETFSSNYIKLLTGTSYADPVWLNIPGYLLADAQVNSEYVAYAINYISGISNNVNVSTIAWSQGNLDTQWALKYWPSTRSTVSDFISISPDFHGTVTANIMCPGFPQLPCDPSVLQQEYNSNFVTTLRSNGGDSAYVPTTTVYSSFDEIVQPQTGTGASAFINDTRNVGVSNNYLQGICPGQPAGGAYTHEGVLYNAVAVSLAIDALTNPGPGSTSRIDTAAQCQKVAADGLSVGDVIGTEVALVLAAFNLNTYEPKQINEPAIMSYAA